jgi:uncharacterized protein YlxP (DUF503 family)
MVGVLTVEFMIYDSRSLKDKRRVVRSIAQRLRDRFNVSVAEVADRSMCQRCTLQIASISGEKAPLHAEFDQMVDTIRSNRAVSLLHYDREFF